MDIQELLNTPNKKNRMPWSTQEDELLREGYFQGLSWGMISSTYLPHRSRGCCWGRFKTLQKRYGWLESEDRRLLTSVRKHTRLFKKAWRSVASDLCYDWKDCESRFTQIKMYHISSNYCA